MKNKYNAQKVIIDGLVLDSQDEGRRYRELKLLEQAGAIVDLVVHPKYELIPKFEHMEGKERAMTYTADFSYLEVKDGIRIVEDVKGFVTQEFAIKRKLFLFTHPGTILRIVKRDRRQ